MNGKFKRRKRKSKSIFILFLILGMGIGLPFGFLIGAGSPTDDHLTMVYSSEKKGWIEDLVVSFKEWYYQQTNRTISVNFRSMGSREMVVALQTGEIKPIIWSPASDLELSDCNTSIPGIIKSSDVYNFIYSPTIIGTWNETPYNNMTGFVDLQKIAIEPGNLRLAHTDPRLSNSGYTSVMMEVSAYFNYSTGAYYNASQITATNLTDSDLANWMRGIEQECDYYGKSTGYLAEKAKTDYDVFFVYENIIIDMNKDPNLGKKAIAIYPKEGLFLNNHPFCILSGDWVSPNDTVVAQYYMEFMGLNSSINQAFKRGFRPIDPSILGNSTYNQTFLDYFNENYGVSYDPQMKIHGVPAEVLVLDYVIDLWLEVRAG